MFCISTQDEKYTVVQTAQAELLIRTPICELLGRWTRTNFGKSTDQPLSTCTTSKAHAAMNSADCLCAYAGHARELPVSRAYVLFKAM